MSTRPYVPRLVLVHLALAALGAWASWSQLVYRCPSRYLTLLLATLTVATTALTLVFGLYLTWRAVAVGPAPLTTLVVVHRVCAVVILAFTFLGLFVFTNGKFDLAEPVHHSTEILRIGMEDTALGVSVPVGWAEVRSWRRSGDVERILLRNDELERVWGGEAVVVSVRPGFHGLPWVSRIEADVEKRSREILAVLPDAAQVQKDLAWFYTSLGRFPEAAGTTRDYTRRFPEDRVFPVQVAKLLTSRDRFADVIMVLTDVAPRRQDADVYMLLGYSLAMQGRIREGVPLLERAREMQPTNWWPHYALGWVYGGSGNYAAATLSFLKAIELRPGLYDAERELQRLAPLAAHSSTR